MLKKEIADWLDVFNNITIPNLLKNGFKATPTNAREGLANITKTLVTDIPEIAQILDDIVEVPYDYNVPVRIFNPNPNEKLPILIHFHGGGHMSGSVTVYDPICRKLAKYTNHIVVAVEYRLAPENPYPCGLNDCYNVVKYIWNTLDSRKIKYKRQLSIFGDSGGGAIATTVVERAQFDKEVKIDKQVLVYPSVDYTMNFPSIEENAEGYLLAKSKIAWYFDNYFSHNECRVKASPLYGQFTNNIPKTLIFTAQYCPLRDEGMEYARKIKEAGVEVELYNLENMIHTFMNMENLCKEECLFVYDKTNKFIKVE